MKQEPQYFGDAVEHNRVAHERALQRAIERDAADEQQEPVNGIGDVPMHDMNVYSEAERAPAAPTDLATLSWAGGEVRMIPQVLEREQLQGLHSAPSVRGYGELMGVDEIAGR